MATSEQTQLLWDSVSRFYQEHPEYLEIIRLLNEKESIDLPSLRQFYYCVVNFAM